jgi:P27 family predicted phage terminase small subunit
MGLRGPKSAEELTMIAQRRRRLGDDRAAISDDRVPPPDHLSPETKAWWRGIVGALEPYQLRTLQAAGEAWDLYAEARQVVAKEGLSYSDDKGRMFARPEIAIARDARVAYLRAMRDLKLDSPPPKEPLRYDRYGNPVDTTNRRGLW